MGRPWQTSVVKSDKLFVAEEISQGLRMRACLTRSRSVALKSSGGSRLEFERLVAAGQTGIWLSRISTHMLEPTIFRLTVRSGYIQLKIFIVLSHLAQGVSYGTREKGGWLDSFLHSREQIDVSGLKQNRDTHQVRN